MKLEAISEKLGGWTEKLSPFILSEAFDNIYSKLREIAKKDTIYPLSKDTYKAFFCCPPDKLKAVIMASDPFPGQYYLSKLPHADGICLSNSNSPDGKLQPSLESFWEGVSKEYDTEYKTHDLTSLAEQGVLLVNRALTVSKGKIGSHMGLFDEFWKYFFENLLPPNIPVILLGQEAKYAKRWIWEMANPCFTLTHPSFAARSGQDWATDGVFKKTEQYIKEHHEDGIKWIQ